MPNLRENGFPGVLCARRKQYHFAGDHVLAHSLSPCKDLIVRNQNSILGHGVNSLIDARLAACSLYTARRGRWAWARWQPLLPIFLRQRSACCGSYAAEATSCLSL